MLYRISSESLQLIINYITEDRTSLLLLMTTVHESNRFDRSLCSVNTFIRTCYLQTFFTQHMKTVFFLLTAFFSFIILQTSNISAQSREECLACHSDESLTMEKNGKTISLTVRESILRKSPHKKFVCVACHVGFDPGNMPHKEKMEPVNCFTCHKDAPVKHSFHPQMIRANGMNGSPDMSCKNCHGKHDVTSPKVEGSKFHPTKLVGSCGACHTDIHSKFVKSAHGKANTAGIHGAPNCLKCHLNPIALIHAGVDTAQHKIAQEKMCLSCHLDNPDVRARVSPTVRFIAAYESSVHGTALLKGNGKAANCVDCHGSHEMNKASESKSGVNKMNIPNRCAQCHVDIAKQFSESIHGIALQKGITNAPACTDCHGEHNILRHTDEKSPVAAVNVSTQVCTPCHSSMKLSEKFGIPSNRTQTFADSYHGLAIRGGSAEAANCASCHGAHNIKPSNDPTSNIHKSNLAKTCGKCHPGANQKFTIGSVHVTTEEKVDPILYWISNLYIVLIVVAVGGMFLHNVFDFFMKAKHTLMIRRGMIEEEYAGHSLYLRMTLSERIQHIFLFTSFIVLVITGFMLRYPDAWWVVSIRHLSDSVFDMRSLLHRIAAVAMIAASAYHVYYLLFTTRGRKLFRDLLPKLCDARDAFGVMKYNLGFSKHKPLLDRFSYVEKAEYWALVWGTAVMAATGVIMWFDNTFIGMFTKLGYDVARTIHFYEAWLATLAIIVWHFYFVIFNPDTYPMNLAWLTGTISEREMAEEHPLELRKLKQQEMEQELTNSNDEVKETKMTS